MKNGKCVTLRIITPAGTAACLECDSVRLVLSDDREGRGGGSYGVRAGHANAVLLLSEGLTLALSEGREVLRAQTGRGFATVENDVVSVVVESAELDE